MWAALMVLALAAGCAEDGQIGNLKDYDENVYKTVVIGEQVWMADNLKSIHYADGTEIDGAMVYQSNDSNIATYGRLYTYDAATRGGDTDKKGRIQGACPKGYHVPTDDEYKELELFLGMNETEASNMAWRGTIEGGMLKEAGTDHWVTPNTDATNSSGFTGLPTGSYNPGLGYTTMGQAGYLWTSTNISETEAWGRVLLFSHGQIGRYPSGKDLGFCIRCLKN